MNNNKGFTLIELIIAISIMSIVIGLGYNVVNKINIATQEQDKITTNQLNANLINKYLTKDLELCKTFEGPEESNIGQEYEFIINKGNDEIIYKVSTWKKGNQETYNLTRNNNNSEIHLITNQPKVSEIPFFISKKQGYSDLYVVELDSSKESLGKYQFEVASRFFISSSQEDIVSGKPEEDFVENEFHKAEFWVNDSDDSKVQIGVFHSGRKDANGKKEYIDYKNVSENLNNRYKINMKISISNASNNDNIFINEGYKTAGETSKYQTQNLKLEQGKIIIEVDEDTEFELEVNDTFIVPNEVSDEKITLKSGKYEYDLKIDKNGDKVRELIVKGSIIKNTQSAKVKVYYGKSK